jgi:hypothetical protein
MVNMINAVQNIPRVGLRWTIGDASNRGFQALRLSVWAAWKIFGEYGQYSICVNTVGLHEAARRAGELPEEVNWVDAGNLIPQFVKQYADVELAEGVAWKFAPVRMYPHLHELSLDNDAILWSLPGSIREWLSAAHPEACLMAADVAPAFGRFSALCDGQALNSGIRGLPPYFDLETRLEQTLRETGITLQSELDEQGLQAAVLSRSKLYVVPTMDVSICSPFSMHQLHLGRCGAHFVGLNRKSLPWILEGRGAHHAIAGNWDRHLPLLETLVFGFPETNRDFGVAGSGIQ